MRNNERLNVIYDAALTCEFIEGKGAPVKIYESIKNYYSFWLSPIDELYYTLDSTKKLYHIISNKFESNNFQNLIQLADALKLLIPNIQIQLVKDNKPSLTLKFTINVDRTYIGYISISLITNFYILFIEEIKEFNTLVHCSPETNLAHYFNPIESIIKDIFGGYTIVPFNMLKISFFDILFPDLNTENKETELEKKNITLIQGLFFDYDLFREGYYCIDNKRYNAEYFAYKINVAEMLQMKQLFLDNIQVLVDM